MWSNALLVFNAIALGQANICTVRYNGIREIEIFYVQTKEHEKIDLTSH